MTTPSEPFKVGDRVRIRERFRENLVTLCGIGAIDGRTATIQHMSKSGIACKILFDPKRKNSRPIDAWGCALELEHTHD